METNNSEKQIFPESEEAAKFVTGISGWVDGKGQFWGDNEKSARHFGSTHKHCDTCGAVIERDRYCGSCYKARRTEQYKKLKKWTPVKNRESHLHYLMM